MNHSFKASFLLLLLLFTACSPVDESLIEGQWTGIAVVEEGSPVNIDPSIIKMSFEGKGYAYASTLNYKESGTYHIDAKYLYTTDTLNQASTEKAVEIVRLTADSLILKMNDSGKERLLMMEKVR